MSNDSDHKSSKAKKTVLWIVAVFIMFSAIVYQRTTGPTYPYRGKIEVAGKEYKHKLIRSEWTTDDAGVLLPQIPNCKAQVVYKRFKTQDEFTALTMNLEKDKLVAYLPKQPAAGKLEYYVELETDNQKIRIPKEEGNNIIIRFKDPVPGYILWPHIIMMFFSVLIGMRAGLGAIFAPDSMRSYVWVALFGMTIGGMTLGPIVQKYAFGEYWTGFPYGGDWTDNKMLIMWIAWLIAAGLVGTKTKKKEGLGRVTVLLASIVMTAVYIIPHSMHGSELDYSKVDSGVDPSKAIKTGKQ